MISARLQFYPGSSSHPDTPEKTITILYLLRKMLSNKERAILRSINRKLSDYNLRKPDSHQLFRN